MAQTLRQQAMNDFLPRTKGRPDYGTVKVREELTPVAKPAEAYFQPPQAQRSPLEDVARALSPLSANLMGLVGEMRKEEEKTRKDTDQAEADRIFVEGNQMGFEEAVRQGKIPAQASPVFTRRYRELEGDRRGREFAAQVEKDFNTWDRREVATPEEVTQWLAERTKTAFQGTDPLSLRAALPHVSRIQDRITNQSVKLVNDRFVNDSLENIKGSVREIVDQGYRDSVLDPRDVPVFSGTRKAAQEIEALTGRMKAAGLRGADLNAAVVDAVTEEAVRRNDPTILEILKKDRANGTPGPGLTSYGQQKLEQAEDKIFRNTERAESMAVRRQEREFKQGNRVATRFVVDTLTNNPDAEIDPNIIELGSRYDPDFGLKVEKIREQVQKRMESDNPVDVRDATRRIWESDRPTAQVFDEVSAGNLRNPGTIRSLLNDAARIEQARGRGNGSFGLDIFKRTKDAIAKSTDPYGTEKNNPDQAAPRAVFDFEMAVADWDARNPEATQIERMKKVKELGDVFLGAIDRGTQQYTPPDMQAITRQQAESAATEQGQRSLVRPAPAQPRAQPEIQQQQQQQSDQSQPPVPDLRQRSLGSQAAPAKEMVFGRGGAVEWMQSRIEELERGGEEANGPDFEKNSFTSKHYSWRDFRNDRFEGAKVSQKTVQALDKVTDEFGRKLTLSSGYRSAEYNQQVSWSGRKGQHVQGTAIDFKVSDYSDEEKARILALFIREGAVGLGYYNNGSMHVDFRSTQGRGPGGLAVWGQGDAPTWFLQGMRDGLKARSSGK